MVKKTVQDIILASLIVTVFTFSGWLIFESVREIFDLSQFSVGVRLVIGLVIMVMATKLGLQKFKLN